MRSFLTALCSALALLLGQLTAQTSNIPPDSTQFGSIETKDRSVAVKQLIPINYWPDNPYATRYLFGPSGYGLEKGEGYYQNTWVFFNQVSYGLSDNFTLGVGTIPLSIFAGIPTPVWVTPKLSFPIVPDQFNLGVGGLFTFILGEESASFGIVYSSMTVGSRDQNVTLGLGYGYAGNRWANTPTVSLSGAYRVGKKFALLSENYLFDTGDDNLVLLSGGARFIGRQIGIDAALIFPSFHHEEVYVLPWLSITVPFGN